MTATSPRAAPAGYSLEPHVQRQLPVKKAVADWSGQSVDELQGTGTDVFVDSSADSCEVSDCDTGYVRFCEACVTPKYQILLKH